MINIKHARQAFQCYLCNYDLTIPLLKLKVIHSYAVMNIMKELSESLHLSEEDCQLAMLIGLLHDIGRFDQWMIYKSFEDHKTRDHADYSSEILFDQHLISSFIETREYDDIIKEAIQQHNKYQIKDGLDHRTLMFVNLIRDADKLDNFRVKEVESFETLFQQSKEQIEQQTISLEVQNAFNNHQLVYSPDRKTQLDMWLSYIAFVFDLHFNVSYHYIHRNDYINKSFDRVSPIETHLYQQLKETTLCFLEGKINES